MPHPRIKCGAGSEGCGCKEKSQWSPARGPRAGTTVMGASASIERLIIQDTEANKEKSQWIPACAGMTHVGAYSQ